jgi:hypothetical protein
MLQKSHTWTIWKNKNKNRWEKNLLKNQISTLLFLLFEWLLSSTSPSNEP